jgi:hypothetical protein
VINLSRDGNTEKIALIDEAGYAMSQIGFPNSRDHWRFKGIHDLGEKIAGNLKQKLVKMSITSTGP